MTAGSSPGTSEIISETTRAGAAAAAIWEWGLGIPYGVPSLVAGLVANQLAFWTVAYSYRKGRTA